MSIPPESPWRGCAANFPQPVNEEDWRAAQNLVRTVYDFNCRTAEPPLPGIVYRSSSGEEDILRQVFRWDLTPYQEVFQNGFQARRQKRTPDEVYYSLDHYVHRGGGRPLDSRRLATHAFVSTTLNSAWHPSLLDLAKTQIEVYRYEIYAPGGIWVAETLGNRYQYAARDEVCFVAGIAPQYIRSAQRFTLIADSRYTRRERVDNVIRVNENFNPQSHSPRLLNIRMPIFDYLDENGKRAPLTISIYRPTEKSRNNQNVAMKIVTLFFIFFFLFNLRWAPVSWALVIHLVVFCFLVVSSSSLYQPGAVSSSSEQEKRQVSVDSTTTDWYGGNVADSKSRINGAFCSSRADEAYLFMKNEYVLLDYAPNTTVDTVLKGPLLICDGFPSLSGTAFAEHGIDSAFGSPNEDEAFIFSGNLCAQIKYTPSATTTTSGKIIKGPMTIIAMFPFFKGTVFESGVDAAFESSRRYEAFLFKGNQYARINYGSDSSTRGLIAVGLITEGFASLKNTIFGSGIEAAFALRNRTDQAYIFKGDSYARIFFFPGTTGDYLMGGVMDMLPIWPNLCTVVSSRKNRGLDVHDHHSKPDADRDHDEL